jgi:hypothetical protein
MAVKCQAHACEVSHIGPGALPWGILDQEVVTVVSSRGGQHGYVVRSRHRAYRAIKRKGASKGKAARIANAGRTRAGRSRMARKAARTRKRRSAG